MRLVFPALLLPMLLLGCLRAAAQQQSGPLVPARFDCAIEGTVVDRITHQPVPRAKISVMWPGGNRSAAADNAGRWSFAGIACAEVHILASRFGYLESAFIGSPPLNFLLSPDSPAHVAIELTPQSVVTGNVVDENGDPVAGMRVVPYIARVVNGKRVLANAPQTVTNDIGEFRIAPLEAGSYIVCVEPSPGQMDEPACYPAPIENGPAGAMRISPGQETAMDFALAPTHPVRVSGSVTNLPTSVHATVQLSRATGIRMEPSLATGVTPEGKFSFPNVPPGSYILSVAPVVLDEQPASARAPVDVDSSDVNNVALTLEPPIPISGAIRLDSENPTAGPAPRVQLSLRPSERNSGAIATVFSDDNRSFTITGVMPGHYRLNFGAGSYFLKSATLGGRDIARGEFTIDAAPGPLEIVISDNGGSLEGDVTLDDSSPAESASILLLRDGELARVVPVQNGHFNIYNLQPGDYTACAWDSIRDVEYANPEWMRQHADASVPVTIQAGQNAPIKLVRQTAPSDY